MGSIVLRFVKGIFPFRGGVRDVFCEHVIRFSIFCQRHDRFIIVGGLVLKLELSLFGSYPRYTTERVRIWLNGTPLSEGYRRRRGWWDPRRHQAPGDVVIFRGRGL